MDWDGELDAPAFKKLTADVSDVIGAPTRPSTVESTPTHAETSTAPTLGKNKSAPVVAKTYEPLSAFRDKLKDGLHGPEMVVIPAGSFRMGSPNNEPERDHNEGPQHTVTFQAPFAIGKYAVTYAEYDLFCEAADIEQPDDKDWGRGQQPVINVSWDNAKAYTEWLSEQTGKQYRVPSEAEWEYAARAGTGGPFSFEGPVSDAKANYNATYTYEGSAKGEDRANTVPVGSLPANPWGLHEVHGTVLEWVEDCSHETYAGAPSDGTAWLASDGGDCDLRVLRGGSWYNKPYGLRSAYRYRGTRGDRDDNFGFRLAQDL